MFSFQMLRNFTPLRNKSSSHFTVDTCKIIESSWSSVLRAGSRLGYKNEEIDLFFSSRCRSDPSLLNSFRQRFPFVETILRQSLKLEHPLKEISLSILKSGLIYPAEKVYFDGASNFHLLPMSILFASKFCLIPANSSVELEQKQLLLTKASLMLHLSQRIHRSVKNNEKRNKDEDKGNKIAILVGDLFITEMYNLLSQLNNNQIVNWMSETLVDFTDKNFPKALCESSQPPGVATKILFANSFACTGMILKMDDMDRIIQQNLQLGYLVGTMCHVHESFRIFLESNSEKNVDEIVGQLQKRLDTLRILHQTTIKLLKRMNGESEAIHEFLILLDYLSLKNIYYHFSTPTWPTIC